MSPRTYADMLALVLQKLQDSGAAEFSATDTAFELEEGLKELGAYVAHANICPVIYKIESRYGSASATSSGNLTDTVKSQFVAADATLEKVVHNTTDDTWATVKTYSSSSVLALSVDIFTSGEQYEIYNRRCWGKRQIWIGDVVDYIRLHRVEYPVGSPRNFKHLSNNVIELDVAKVGDSNPTLATLEPVDVLILFAKPHVLSQLSDWAGEVDLGAGYAAGTTTIHVDGLATAETIEEGEQFYLENHRTLYTITADTTLSSNEGDITFYPGLEGAVIDNDDITFVKSSLLADDEDILAELVAARLLLYHAPKFINLPNIGGGDVTTKFETLGERILNRVRTKLRAQGGARTTYDYPRY